MTSITSTIKLSGGHSIPQLGLGVWQSKPPLLQNAIKAAFECGYRHIDSAKAYGNEKACGEAIREAMKSMNIPRSEIFYTTKIGDSYCGTEITRKTIQQCLKEVDIEYIDLLLIHSPYAGTKKRLEAWKVMEDFVEQGLIKEIGVSNYGISPLQELLENCKTPPAVNQLELHPWLARKDLVAFCRSHGIALEAYSPLTRFQRTDEPALLKICKKHDKTPAQVLVRWSLQQGFIPLPKSSKPERVKENSDVYGFKLDNEDLAALDTDEYSPVCWDPTKEP